MVELMTPVRGALGSAGGGGVCSTVSATGLAGVSDGIGPVWLTCPTDEPIEPELIKKLVALDDSFGFDCCSLGPFGSFIFLLYNEKKIELK
jgi:hypothetical protein